MWATRALVGMGRKPSVPHMCVCGGAGQGFDMALVKDIVGDVVLCESQ